MSEISLNNGWATLLSGRNGLRSIALAAGVMLHATDVYLATTIMPSITHEIGGLNLYSWATTIYILAAIIGSVVSSKNLIKQGPRTAYRTAILFFSLGALMCALAPNMYLLLVGRFVQGIGGGLLFALSYAMISIVFEESLWPRAMALVSAMWGVSAFSGPFIGGVFAEFGNWRMAFVTLFGIALALLFLTENVLPKKENNTVVLPLVPYKKLLLLICAALSISVGSITDDTLANLVGIVVAIAFIIILIYTEKRSPNRLLPHGAYQISSALGATYLIMALLTIGTAVEIYIPYFMQVIHQFSPLRAGYLTVLIALGWSFASIIFSGMAKRYVKTLIFISPILVFAGLAGLIYLMPSTQSSEGWTLVIMCLLLLVIGAGVGMGWSHLLTRVLTVAQKGEEEKASASISTVQLLSTAFGTALAGLVANVFGLVNPGGLVGAQSSAQGLFALFALAPIGAFLLVIASRKK